MLRQSFMAAAVAAGLAFAGTAHAVSFDISGGSYSLGSDYGCSGTGNTTTLFCATFNVTIGDPAPFTLDNATPSKQLNFGTIVFNEDMNNIVAGETDNLGVTAILNFTDPFAGNVQSVAVIGVFIGTINDVDVDYSLTFDPVTQNFGNGGQFKVDFDDMSWTGNDTTPRVQKVTITLLSAPQEQQQEESIQAIPEPGTLALAGSALIGLAFARRRRR